MGQKFAYLKFNQDFGIGENGKPLFSKGTVITFPIPTAKQQKKWERNAAIPYKNCLIPKSYLDLMDESEPMPEPEPPGTPAPLMLQAA